MLNRVNAGRLKKLKELQSISRAAQVDVRPDMFIGIDVSLSGSAFSFSCDLPQHYHESIYATKKLVDFFRYYKGRISLEDKSVASKLIQSVHINLFPETSKVYLSYKVSPPNKASERDRIAYLAECSEVILKNPFALLCETLNLQQSILQSPSSYGLSKEGEKKLMVLSDKFDFSFASYLRDVSLGPDFTSVACIEDVNVSTQFTGMRAVSIAFGVISATLSRSCLSPYYFMATKTMMSSMTKRYNEDIEKETSKIKAVRKFKNEHKIDVLDFVKNMLDVDISDDDIADSLGHCFLCENLVCALEECQKLVLDLELNDQYVSSTYLSLNKKIIEEYRLTNLDSLTKTLEHSMSKTLI